MGITIKDIAKIAGVSHTTVSRALNDSPLIKASTIKRIKAIAKAEGYSPNYTARALKMNKSFTYGLFFSTLKEASTNHFVYEVIRGVRQQLPQSYRLTVESIDELSDFDQINSKNYDGILIISQRYEDDLFIQMMKERNIPVVVLNRILEDNAISSIAFDDDIGIDSSVAQLVEFGHRAIAFIGGKKGFCNSDKRYDGFNRGLDKVGLSYDERLIEEGDFTMVSGYNSCKRLLEKAHLTAVICANDEMAVGVMKAVREAGLNVGKDISLIGFDDNENNLFTNPPLASVHRSIVDMADEGIAQLNKLVVDETTKHVKKILKTELRIRASVEALK